MAPLPAEFYDRPVVEVARALIGCTVGHGRTSGVIVETEAYHDSEPACHAYIGLTRRTATLFGPPGQAYVYRSYGIHALLNAVCEHEGAGAAVLLRALSPLSGIELMRERRGGRRPMADRELCSGPGKLTQALAIDLAQNNSSLINGPVTISAPTGTPLSERILSGPRIGITKAVDLPWRFWVEGEENVSAGVSRRR